MTRQKDEQEVFREAQEILEKLDFGADVKLVSRDYVSGNKGMRRFGLRGALKKMVRREWWRLLGKKNK